MALIEFRGGTDERGEQAPVSTMYVSDPSTGTVEWNLRPANRVNDTPELTVYDLRELARCGYNNEALNYKAKRIYAARGTAKNIEKACDISPSYAKKLHAAFGRAKKVQEQK